MGAARDLASAYLLPWDIAADVMAAAGSGRDNEDQDAAFEYPDGGRAPEGMSRLYAMIGSLSAPQGL